MLNKRWLSLLYH